MIDNALVEKVVLKIMNIFVCDHFSFLWHCERCSAYLLKFPMFQRNVFWGQYSDKFTTRLSAH